MQGNRTCLIVAQRSAVDSSMEGVVKCKRLETQIHPMDKQIK